MKKKMLISLLNWNSSNGLKGYDPYDIVSLNRFTRSLMIDFKELSFFKKIIRFSIERLSLKFPVLLRKLLFIQKKVHPTYLGCMMHTYILLSKQDQNKYLSEINLYRSELIKIRSKMSNYYAWGVPFTWLSEGVEMKEGTPFAVTANWIGSAFIELYKLRGNNEDLEIAVSLCEFILNDLHRTQFDDGTICFSYSTEKVDLINNANLFAADLLIKVGEITNNNSYLKIAKMAIDFSISTQLDSGLIPYTAKSKSLFNDSYHGSYELQCLYRAWKVTGEQSYKVSFNKYFDYYIESYFNNDGNVSKYSNKKYPIDSTSNADALILFAVVKEDRDVLNYVDKLMNNLASFWQDKSGFFFYQKTSSNNFVKIPFTRWTQGWTALALAYWYEK